jgi:hypothetical protein
MGRAPGKAPDKPHQHVTRWPCATAHCPHARACICTQPGPAARPPAPAPARRCRRRGALHLRGVWPSQGPALRGRRAGRWVARTHARVCTRACVCVSLLACLHACLPACTLPSLLPIQAATPNTQRMIRQTPVGIRFWGFRVNTKKTQTIKLNHTNKSTRRRLPVGVRPDPSPGQPPNQPYHHGLARVAGGRVEKP